ncbi:2448_t:CDS:2 [Scutellospora calospora]|uniref:2448_t:CDS:1 n=1 Tax=Scutellospora calospora TaxID=85575 RepID=A0ACA9JUK6_9GLOM|nr:2448_t:CDS:2 [Scutellospora calospora]
MKPKDSDINESEIRFLSRISLTKILFDKLIEKHQTTDIYSDDVVRPFGLVHKHGHFHKQTKEKLAKFLSTYPLVQHPESSIDINDNPVERLERKINDFELFLRDYVVEEQQLDKANRSIENRDINLADNLLLDLDTSLPNNLLFDQENEHEEQLEDEDTQNSVIYVELSFNNWERVKQWINAFGLQQ